jgi:DedD protein
MRIMEKRKLLLVAISVGVFLVIVIGASILVFTPKGPSPAAAAAAVTVMPIPAGNPVNPGNPVKTGPSSLPGAVAGAADLGIKISPDNSSPDNILYIYGEKPADIIKVDKTSSSGGNRLIVDVRQPTEVVVPDAPRVTAKPVAAPARESPAPAPKAAAPKPKAPAPKPKAAAAQPAAPQKPVDFWVQTGSFSTVARAETAKNTLASKGITALIENRSVEGQDFFRVRVGPYASKNEADYWRELIKVINGFEESLVLQSPAN